MGLSGPLIFSFFSMGNPLLGESIISMGNMFSRIVAKGSRFIYFGGLGSGPVFAGRCFHVLNRATVRNRAAVRNRPRPAKGHTFGGAAQVVTTCKSYCKPVSSWECHRENHFAWQGQYLVQVRWCRMLFCVASTVFGTHNSYTLYSTFYTLHL